MWPGVEWDFTETFVVFLAAFGLAQYFGQIVFGVLELHGSLGATVATFLLEASGPAVIFGWLRSVGRPRPAWLGRAGRRAGDVGLGFVIGLALLFSSGICVAITIAIAKAILGHQPTLPNPAQGFRGGWLIPLGLMLCVTAPLCEEILFRGFLFRGLRTRWGWWPAALVSSLLFALAHGSPYRLLNIFVDGLILSAIYERRKSLLTTITAHATLNTIIFITILTRLY
ncbi:MAG: protease family protein [Actinomycetota bacterium]|nr:protease family protein [Actinomycetota bacterium]